MFPIHLPFPGGFPIASARFVKSQAPFPKFVFTQVPAGNALPVFPSIADAIPFYGTENYSVCNLPVV